MGRKLDIHVTLCWSSCRLTGGPGHWSATTVVRRAVPSCCEPRQTVRWSCAKFCDARETRGNRLLTCDLCPAWIVSLPSVQSLETARHIPWGMLLNFGNCSCKLCRYRNVWMQLGTSTWPRQLYLEQLLKWKLFCIGRISFAATKCLPF